MAMTVWLLFLSAVAAGPPVDVDPIEERFAIFQRNIDREHADPRTSLSDRKLQRVVRDEYERLFRPKVSQNLKNLSSVELDLLHRAAELAAFYSKDSKYASDMLIILGEMERKGEPTEGHYEATYRMLIRVRDLTRARDFATRHPQLLIDALPEIRQSSADADGKGPRAWIVSPDRNELIERHVDINRGAQIVVVSHPLCHFSRDAISFIHSDPLLAPLFRVYAKWIGPQDGRLNIPALQLWNRQHPDYPMMLVVKQDEWPFDYWGTPTFYFLRDGAVAAKIVGWPREGRREQLLAAFRKTRLLK